MVRGIYYTLESLKPLNTPFDCEHGLNQRDVELVNIFVKIAENSHSEVPCYGDIVEYTNEYGEFHGSAHISAYDTEAKRILMITRPLVPFVFPEDNGAGWSFDTCGPKASIDPALLKPLGKREKQLKTFGHCGITGGGGVCFRAPVNAWEYIEPNQRHPGYSTKDWVKRYITYMKNPQSGGPYHYFGCYGGHDTIVRNAEELQLWKDTFKAVEFPGTTPNEIIVFHYRETEKLLSRKEWDALDLPLDTRDVNGLIHVKVAYDDKAHMVTTYRFTNSGYLDPKCGPYARAKGIPLHPPDQDAPRA